MDFDELLEEIGGLGFYQKLLFITLNTLYLGSAFSQLGIVFIAGVPDHWCAVPELDVNLTSDVIKNLTIPLEDRFGAEQHSQCQMYNRNYTGWSAQDVERCLSDPLCATAANVTDCHDGWTYDTSIYTSTIVSEWDLVCDRRWLQATQTAVGAVGVLVGFLISGTVSDIYGRLITLVGSLILFVSMYISTSFAPSYIAFVVFRFVVGFSLSGMYVFYLIGMELTVPRWRAHWGMASQYFWVAGYMVIPLLAYAIRDWRKLQLAASVPTVLYFLLFLIVKESPRWLYTQKKNERADAIVRSIAKINGAKVPDQINILLNKEKRGYIWDLFRTPRIRYQTLDLGFIWLVNALVYYGLSLNTSNLGGNDFLNFFIAGAVEIPAMILCQISLSYIGRRYPLCLALLLGGIAQLCTLAVPSDMTWLNITLAMFGKFCITGSYAMLLVYTIELFPTMVRANGFNVCNVCGVLGIIAAPYIAQLSDFGSSIPLVIFGVMSLAGGLLVLPLPETLNQKLQETIVDSENLGKKSKGAPDVGDVNVEFEKPIDDATNPTLSDPATGHENQAYLEMTQL